MNSFKVNFKEGMQKAYSATVKKSGELASAGMHAAEKHVVQSDIIRLQVGDLKMPPRRILDADFPAVSGRADLRQKYDLIVEQCRNARNLGTTEPLKSGAFEDAFRSLTEKSFTAGGGGDVAKNVKEFTNHARQVASRQEHIASQLTKYQSNGFLTQESTKKLHEDQRRVYQAAGPVPQELLPEVRQYRKARSQQLDNAYRVGKHKHAVKGEIEQLNEADQGNVREAIKHFIALREMNPQLAQHYIAGLKAAVTKLADRTKASIDQMATDRDFEVDPSSKPLLKEDLATNIQQIRHAENPPLVLIAPGTAANLHESLQATNPAPPPAAPYDYDDNPFND